MRWPKNSHKYGFLLDAELINNGGAAQMVLVFDLLATAAGPVSTNYLDRRKTLLSIVNSMNLMQSQDSSSPLSIFVKMAVPATPENVFKLVEKVQLYSEKRDSILEKTRNPFPYPCDGLIFTPALRNKKHNHCLKVHFLFILFHISSSLSIYFINFCHVILVEAEQ